MKASDYIVRFLEAQGITHVFGYQGGMITHLVDSLSRSRKIRFVPCYHEQSAAFAAEGYARATGRFGVCITTSGPGATNTVTSVGNAYFDSVPVLYLTGQVNTYEFKYGSAIRQKGFQETDIVAVAAPLAKRTFMADVPARLNEDLISAIRLMLSPRRGPVVMDLPMDVQRAEIGIPDEIPLISPEPSVRVDEVVGREMLSELVAAKRPLVVCGGGLAQVCARRLFGFLARSGLPYVVSLMGKGLVDESSSACMGMIGSYGNRCANLALAEADVVLSLGSRLDLRQTGNRNSPVLATKRFLRVDVDPEEIVGNALPSQKAYLGGVEAFLGAEARQPKDWPSWRSWKDRLHELRSMFSQDADVARFAENRLPYELLAAIAATAADDAVFVADVGQNQMWAAQTIRTKPHQSFLTSGGMAPMGYALPAAVGAAFAEPGRQVVCIVGDGGLHLSLQSLPLISQYRLPVTVILMNNRALGMITQFQRLYLDGNLAGTVAAGGYLVPDFSRLAAAYGMPYEKIKSAEGFNVGDHVGKLVEVSLDGLTNVVPKLEYNRSLDDMTPTFDGERLP